MSLQANGSEPVTGYVLSVSDPEGDPLTILWNTNVSCGAVSVAITELSATWTHSEAQCGIHPPGKVTVHAGTVGVSVSDGHNPPVVVTLSGSGSGHAP